MEVKTEIKLEGIKDLERLLEENRKLVNQLHKNITKIGYVRLRMNAELKGVEFTSDSDDERRIENVSRQIQGRIQEQISKYPD